MGDVAELSMSCVPRFVGFHSSGLIFVGAPSDVKSEFVVEVAIELVAMEKGAESSQEVFRPVRHDDAFPFALFVAQGQRRLDVRGAACGHNAGDDTNR